MPSAQGAAQPGAGLEVFSIHPVPIRLSGEKREQGQGRVVAGGGTGATCDLFWLLQVKPGLR